MLSEIDYVRVGKRIRSVRKECFLTQDELAVKIQLMGMSITKLMISRIEQNQRHVCDAELLMFSKALNVSMEWLCGEEQTFRI